MAIELSDPVKFGIGGAVGVLLGGYVAYKLGQRSAGPALRACLGNLSKTKGEHQEALAELGSYGITRKRLESALEACKAAAKK
jgi:hypothetical protein